MSPRARNESQHGFTLIEILFTIWIMGAVMVAFMGALLTMTKASDITRKTAVAQTELRHYADAVNSAPYVNCGSPSSYSAATVGYSPPANVTANTPTNLAFWDRYAYEHGYSQAATWVNVAALTADTNNTTLMGYQISACDGSPDQLDDGVQQVTISVTVGPSPAVTYSTTITKRSISVPGS
jgi:prepilin-type N-terminal cleavage/methylation domain-containing protein